MKSPRARRVDVPESITSREDLAGANRAITYELPAEDAASLTPEQWARETFEGAPFPVRWILVLGFKFVLGLKLERGRAPNHVLGWQKSEDPSDTVTLAAGSWLMAAHNVATVQDSSVVWTTLVRYKKGLCRPVWWPVEQVHKVLMPYILTHAGRVHANALSERAQA